MEIELPMPLRLEAVDVNHPGLVALLRGPLVLMAVADSQSAFTANSLLQARPATNTSEDWAAASADGSQITMRPFMKIDQESYSTYVRIKS